MDCYFFKIKNEKIVQCAKIQGKYGSAVEIVVCTRSLKCALHF